MSILDTVKHWAGTAWNDFTGAVQDPVRAFESLWKFVSSTNTMQQWLMRFPLWHQFVSTVAVVEQLVRALRMIGDALDRIEDYIWRQLIAPLRAQLLGLIRADRYRERQDIALVRRELGRAFRWLLLFTVEVIKTEQQRRARAVTAARRYSAALTAAALAAVQREAASAYATGLKGRVSMLEKIIGDLAGRNPLIKDIEAKAVTAILDLISVDDPALRLLVGFLVNRIVKSAGTDSVAGDLLRSLVGPLIEDPKPKTLYGVVKDVAARLAALEAQQQQFMADGGPEVENAGRQWNAITSLAADAAMIAFAGQAMADPAGWAAEIATVMGGPANDILGGIVGLVERA